MIRYTIVSKQLPGDQGVSVPLKTVLYAVRHILSLILIFLPCFQLQFPILLFSFFVSPFPFSNISVDQLGLSVTVFLVSGNAQTAINFHGTEALLLNNCKQNALIAVQSQPVCVWCTLF